MHRKHALDSFAVRNTANGKGFIQTAPFPADHDPGENLNTLLVAFHHSSMDADGIADAKLRQLRFELFFLNGVNDAVHSSSFFAGAQFPQMRAKRKCPRRCCDWLPANYNPVPKQRP